VHWLYFCLFTAIKAVNNKIFWHYNIILVCTWSVNIKFICWSFRNRKKSECLRNFSLLFWGEYINKCYNSWQCTNIVFILQQHASKKKKIKFNYKMANTLEIFLDFLLGVYSSVLIQPVSIVFTLHRTQGIRRLYTSNTGITPDL